MRAHINGVELFFDVVSSGIEVDPKGDREKPVLFVQHGGPGADHGYFRPYLDELGEVAQLVYVDHRGTGRSSDAPLDTYTVEQMADDLEALRQHLGLGRIMLLGHSYGGMVAQVFALRHPDSLEKLILSHTAPDWGFWEEAQQNAERIATPEQKEVFRELFEGTISNQAEYEAWWRMCQPLYFRTPDPAVIEALSNRANGRFEVASHMMAEVLPHFNAYDRLDEISAPTLVLASIYDWVTPPSQAERIMGRLPNARYALFEQSGHQPFAVEEQRLYLDTIAGFIAE